jgi:hypothetical protein
MKHLSRKWSHPYRARAGSVIRWSGPKAKGEAAHRDIYMVIREGEALERGGLCKECKSGSGDAYCFSRNGASLSCSFERCGRHRCPDIGHWSRMSTKQRKLLPRRTQSIVIICAGRPAVRFSDILAVQLTRPCDVMNGDDLSRQDGCCRTLTGSNSWNNLYRTQKRFQLLSKNLSTVVQTFKLSSFKAETDRLGCTFDLAFGCKFSAFHMFKSRVREGKSVG